MLWRRMRQGEMILLSIGALYYNFILILGLVYIFSHMLYTAECQLLVFFGEVTPEKVC